MGKVRNASDIIAARAANPGSKNYINKAKKKKKKTTIPAEEVPKEPEKVKEEKELTSRTNKQAFAKFSEAEKQLLKEKVTITVLNLISQLRLSQKTFLGPPKNCHILFMT